jgi:hypothetical protein
VLELRVENRPHGWQTWGTVPGLVSGGQLVYEMQLDTTVESYYTWLRKEARRNRGKRFRDDGEVWWYWPHFEQAPHESNLARLGSIRGNMDEDDFPVIDPFHLYTVLKLDATKLEDERMSVQIECRHELFGKYFLDVVRQSLDKFIGSPRHAQELRRFTVARPSAADEPFDSSGDGRGC